MDPDALLQRLLDLTKRPLLNGLDAEELAAGIENLDQWIRGGGFMPARWKGTQDDNPND